MKRLRDALTLFILLMAGKSSVLPATRLSQPSIPDFRLPSAGVFNPLFRAVTGGRRPFPPRAGAPAFLLVVLLALGLAALFFGGSSPVEAQGNSATLMCAPGWEMVGTRCKYLSFGIQVLWRDAIYCQAGTQPNPGHTRCVPMPEPAPVSPPPSSGEDEDEDEDEDDDDEDGSGGLTGVIGPPLYTCGAGQTYNVATGRCEADSSPLVAPSVSNFRVPSRSVVDTVFPVATGGTPPYRYACPGCRRGFHSRLPRGAPTARFRRS